MDNLLLNFAERPKPLWELSPKKPYYENHGFHSYLHDAHETKVSILELSEELEKSGIDRSRLRDALRRLQEEGLIEEFEQIDPYH